MQPTNPSPEVPTSRLLARTDGDILLRPATIFTGTVTIYHNGTQVGTAAIAGPSYTSATSSFVGGVQDDSGTGPALTTANHFSGHIGEARSFDYPLEAAEMLALANNRIYSPLQPLIQASTPYQSTQISGGINQNETQTLQFSSGSTPTFSVECDASLPASYTVSDMQTAMEVLYVVPVSVTAAESIDRLRNWASGRCLSAGEPGRYRLKQLTQTARRRAVAADPSHN